MGKYVHVVILGNPDTRYTLSYIVKREEFLEENISYDLSCEEMDFKFLLQNVPL